MKWHALEGQDWAKAIGVAVSILTAAFMVTAVKVGVSPLPLEFIRRAPCRRNPSRI